MRNSSADAAGDEAPTGNCTEPQKGKCCATISGTTSVTRAPVSAAGTESVPPDGPEQQHAQ